MGKIKWTSDLSVNVNLIDEQHKMLFQHLDDLSVALDEGQGEKKISTTLNFLVEYTHFHFSTEVKYMKNLNYPGTEYHQQQHDEFVTTLNHLVEDFKEEGATHALATAINVFLNNWLINHIKSIDVQFGKFLKEKGLQDIEA